MAAPEINYEQIHEGGYEAKVAATHSVQFVPNVRSPIYIISSGPCPRCSHGTSYTYPVMIFRGLEELDEATAEELWDVLRKANKHPRTWTFAAICQCAVKHPAAGDDAAGCGAYWNVMAVASKNGATP